MRLRLLPLPFVLLALVLGIIGGWVRLGWNIESVSSGYLHGLLMTGGFLGTLITLERTVSMPSVWWRAFPAISALSTICFVAGYRTAGFAALVVGNVGLLAVYLIQMFKHKDAYWYMLMAGGACWLIGNVTVLKTGLVASGTTWWVAFIFLTIVAERLELTRYLNVPDRAKALLWVLMLLLLWGVALPFHSGTGRWLMGTASVGVAVWLWRFDMARLGVRKSGFHRYVAVGLLVGYGWLLLHGLSVFLLHDQPMFYDLYLHTFFLGFAFSMIWAHAPIILPAILKTTQRPYHPVLWVFWAVFQVTLLGRVMAAWANNAEWRKWLGGMNGLVVLVLFATMAAILVVRLRRVKQ